MRVLYIICNVTNGKGGHFHSLSTTVVALSNNIQYKVIVIGLRPSEVFNDISGMDFVYFNGINFISAFTKIYKITKSFKPKVLHSFDTRANSFARLLSKLFNLPVFHTQCGGKHKRNIPFNKNFILYSNENYNQYTQLNKFENSNLYLIPNRVGQIENDENCISHIKNIVRSRKIILRISRISDYYAESFFQAVNLTNRLNSDGILSVLLLIGVKESSDLVEKLRLRINESNDLIVLDDDIFTNRASKCIDAADMVIGSGRGFMEAAAQKKILLTMLKQSQLPIFVNEENFEILFKTNFSPRNSIENYKIEDNYQELKQILNNDNKKNEYIKFIDKIYDKHFNIYQVIDKYLTMYNEAEINTKFYLLDFFIHLILTIRFVLKHRSV